MSNYRENGNGNGNGNPGRPSRSAGPGGQKESSNYSRRLPPSITGSSRHTSTGNLRRPGPQDMSRRAVPGLNTQNIVFSEPGTTNYNTSLPPASAPERMPSEARHLIQNTCHPREEQRLGHPSAMHSRSQPAALYDQESTEWTNSEYARNAFSRSRPYGPHTIAQTLEVPSHMVPSSAGFVQSPFIENLQMNYAEPIAPQYPPSNENWDNSYAAHSYPGVEPYTATPQDGETSPVDYDHSSEYGIMNDPEDCLEYMNDEYGGMDPEKNMYAMSQMNIRPMVRYKTIKRVKLYQGNLVLDCPVPERLLASLPRKKGREFTHMRYTAATCDPDDFVAERFTLRPPLYAVPRQTELFIVATMYNEDDVLFTRTMYAIQKNINYFTSKTRSKIWNDEAWKKIVVCIVSDGRNKINPRVLNILATLGVYQEGVAKNSVMGKEVEAHIYEYTTQIAVDSKMNIHHANMAPMQIIFCLKERNKKKLNSHRWFFQAFGPVLNPNICVLIDIGTKPGHESIYHLWKTFDLNPNVGGACGEIRAMTGKAGYHLLNPLIAAQNFEYKISNILDKPFESIFGYITVLPGAFSAYRYIALQNDAFGAGPLEKYFKQENNSDKNTGIFEANMYLAEDRILCFELVSKRKCSWTLNYVKSAYAETDVPDKLPELVSQRRRWLNGSFFTALYSLLHFYRIWRSSHNIIAILLFHIAFLYQFLQVIFSWFMLANFFIVFSILTKAVSASDALFKPGKYIHLACTWIYCTLLLTCFVLSLGNRPQGSKWAYLITAIFFACLMGYMLFCSGWLAYRGIVTTIDALRQHGQLQNSNTLAKFKLMFKEPVFRDLIISTGSTYIMYLVSSVISLDPWHMITSFIQYLLLSPSYTNILNVYAFCNTHDVSWGTKGETKVKKDLGVVKTKKDDGAVDVALPSDQDDINKAYMRAVQLLGTKDKREKIKRSTDTKQEDFYRNFRTNVVLFWMITNAALVSIVLNIGIATVDVDIQQQNHRMSQYLGFILWAVAALSAARFIGFICYMVRRIFVGE